MTSRERLLCCSSACMAILGICLLLVRILTKNDDTYSHVELSALIILGTFVAILIADLCYMICKRPYQNDNYPELSREDPSAISF